MRDDLDVPSLEELYTLMRQLEDATREAHVHLSDEIAEQEDAVAAQAERVDELEEELANVRRELRSVEQRLVALEEGTSDGNT